MNTHQLHLQRCRLSEVVFRYLRLLLQMYTQHRHCHCGGQNCSLYPSSPQLQHILLPVNTVRFIYHNNTWLALNVMCTVAIDVGLFLTEIVKLLEKKVLARDISLLNCCYKYSYRVTGNHDLVEI